MSRRIRSNGFTIVELLIVIVVIGILAAITIVAFNGVQERAKINQASSELANMKKAMLAYKVNRSELPPTGDSWNYGSNPPTCTPIESMVAALAAEGFTGISATDPWGNCWGYDDNDCNTGSAAGSATFIESIGPDGLNGGPDDISVRVSLKESDGC